VLSGAVGAVRPRRLPGTPEMARLAGGLVLVLAPLALWVAYLSAPDPLAYRFGGLRNFALPLEAYVDTWSVTLDRLRADGWQSFSRFKLLALVSLTTQVAVLCARPRWRHAWWRVGVLYGLLMLVLGPAVWEGHPGAETRVLLPLTVAFNILLPRGRAFWPLLVLGNLTVIAGLEILQVPVVWRHV